MSHFVDPPCLDMVDRLSRSSSLRRTRTASINRTNSLYVDELSINYKTAGTPHTDNVPEADLEVCTPDPPHLALMDPRWAGLVVQSIAIGDVSTVLPLSVYPFLTAYINMEGTQTLSARTLLAIPWCFRPFFRIVLDWTLAVDQRHRVFIVLGWYLANLALIAMFLIDIPKPYFGDAKLIGKPRETMTDVQLATLNLDARTHGAIYILLMSVATIGYVLADVVADVLIQDIAQRCFPPPTPDQDSPFVARVTMPRYGAMLMPFLFVGIGMNGCHYGGDFDFTLSFNQIMLVTGIIAWIPIPFAWCLMESVEIKCESFVGSFQRIGHLFQDPAIASVIACRFMGGISLAASVRRM